MQLTAQCTNCEASIPDAANYCPQCGQSAHHHRLSLHHIGHELVHFFTHADKGIFYLVRMLATHPGRVVREYVSGKRKKYFSPLNFFLIVLGLFVFVQTTFRPLQGIDMARAKEGVMQIPDREVRERRLMKLERIERATDFMAKNSNYINMALTPIIALIFFIFYRKAGYNYAEHLIANMYFSGFNALFYIVLIVPYLVLTKNTLAYFAGVIGFLLWEAVYRSIGYYYFMNRRGTKHYLYALFIALLVVISWYLFSTSLMGYYIEKGF